MPEARLVLDTCALLWLVSGDRTLSRSALETIERASIVFVSPISAWEISLKHSRKALKLPCAPLERFIRAVQHHNLVVAPLDLEVMVGANQLPWHHRDPADRFIIATAVRERATVVTGDNRFAKYDVGVIV